MAARRGNIDKVRCLVENGADVNSKDEDGVSGLDCLRMYRCVVIGTSETYYSFTPSGNSPARGS